jgi:large subunit ribosomal protein L37Ae
MTRIVGSTGRFGARYGKTIRTKVLEIEKKQRTIQKCPYCKAQKVSRSSAGIWKCFKCNAKFTGRAYTPTE